MNNIDAISYLVILIPHIIIFNIATITYLLRYCQEIKTIIFVISGCTWFLIAGYNKGHKVLSHGLYL